jgi:hypothetical protein
MCIDHELIKDDPMRFNEHHDMQKESNENNCMQIPGLGPGRELAGSPWRAAMCYCLNLDKGIPWARKVSKRRLDDLRARLEPDL